MVLFYKCFTYQCVVLSHIEVTQVDLLAILFTSLKTLMFSDINQLLFLLKIIKCIVNHVLYVLCNLCLKCLRKKPTHERFYSFARQGTDKRNRVWA